MVKSLDVDKIPFIRSGSRHVKQQYYYARAEVGQLPSARTIGMQLNVKF
jgi:hypothetical protein